MENKIVDPAPKLVKVNDTGSGIEGTVSESRKVSNRQSEAIIWILRPIMVSTWRD